MTVEVKVPGFGDSITTVVLVEWLKKVGDVVAVDEELVEVESDKATQKMPAPSAGTVSKLLKGPGDSADVGEVIALIDESVTAGSSPAAGSNPPAAAAPAPTSAPSPASQAPRVMPAAAAALAEN